MVAQMRPRILVIDDSVLIRLKVKEILNKEFLNLIGEAENGEEGYQKYLDLKPDVVLLDMVMEKVDGIGFLRKVRENDKELIIIIISSHSDMEKVSEAVELGINNYILKPIQEKKLLEIIRLEWQKHKQKQKKF